MGKIENCLIRIAITFVGLIDIFSILIRNIRDSYKISSHIYIFAYNDDVAIYRVNELILAQSISLVKQKGAPLCPSLFNILGLNIYDINSSLRKPLIQRDFWKILMEKNLRLDNFSRKAVRWGFNR